ncbi:hypothetical protein MtrunA17_Chr2g0290911 [Medicago truncatula]|uniref:Uncharacterized protein n=1 Tax=Medicago truncatula TaxID=3880 RepID=A2Q5G0_MEDTR|nr:hypothetical protein MtrDRAFT_AC161399g34v2 [Medicago truncatula]RHN72726.1 hypothetical protein MtrunA17_Chr2g0290911 [Medicago truncatula]
MLDGDKSFGDIFTRMWKRLSMKQLCAQAVLNTKTPRISRRHMSQFSSLSGIVC